MMGHHLEQVHAMPGVHLSALHASEPSIYGRFGYGLAGLELSVALGRGTTLTAPHLDAEAALLRTELATRRRPRHARAGAAGLGARRRPARSGSITGDDDFYVRIFTETPEELRGKEPMRLLFARRDGAGRRPRGVPPRAQVGEVAARAESSPSSPWSASRRPGSRCCAGCSTST